MVCILLSFKKTKEEYCYKKNNIKLNFYNKFNK